MTILPSKKFTPLTAVLMATLISIPANAHKLSDGTDFMVRSFSDLNNLAVIAHIEEKISELNDRLYEHNLIVSEMLIAPVLTGNNDETGGVRARSAPDEEFSAEVTLTFDSREAPVNGGTRTRIVFYEN